MRVLIEPHYPGSAVTSADRFSEAARALVGRSDVASRRCPVVTGLGAVLAAPLGTGAQQAGRISRIGGLGGGPPLGEHICGLALWGGLGALGYSDMRRCLRGPQLEGAQPADLPVEQPTKLDFDQPVDRQGSRPHHAAVAAATGGPGHRVNRRAFVTVGAQQATKTWRI